MNILFITDPYPSSKYPTNGVFVYNFVQQLEKKGHEVTVISNKNILTHLFKRKHESYGPEKAQVYLPKILSTSSKQIGSLNTYIFTRKQKVYNIKQIVKKYEIEFDIIYCHFIQSALIAVEALSNYNKPIFVALGESSGFKHIKKWYGKRKFKYYLEKINGYITVSNALKNELIINGINESNIILEPNCTDLNLFYKRDKNMMRKKYKLPKNKFLAIFVGNYIERKGPLRALMAVEKIKDTYIIYAGKGPQQPKGKKVIFNNNVKNLLIPELLSAADVFILPTKQEGASNAIIEAMACGLPIISSNIPEVMAQCNTDFSILVDPMNIQEISNAIHDIKNNPEKAAQMSEKALEKSQKYDITKRTERIIEFVKRIKNDNVKDDIKK